MNNNRIFLIGHIASGKTAAAKALSEIYGFTNIDMDSIIEKVEDSSIKKMFIKYGEHEFRNKEAEYLDKLCNVSDIADVIAGDVNSSSKRDDKKSKYDDYCCFGQDHIVVSCGAGIILDDVNRKILKNQKTVFLDGDAETLFHRIKDRTDLPYAFMEDQDEKVRLQKFIELYDKRKDLYAEASSYTVTVDNKTPEQIARDIMLTVGC